MYLNTCLKRLYFKRNNKFSQLTDKLNQKFTSQRYHKNRVLIKLRVNDRSNYSFIEINLTRRSFFARWIINGTSWHPRGRFLSRHLTLFIWTVVEKAQAYERCSSASHIWLFLWFSVTSHTSPGKSQEDKAI